MRTPLLLLTLLFFGVGLQAQTGRIRGKVVDKGQGLAGCEITIYEGVEKVAVLVADANGEFNFGEVKAGCYDVEALIGSIPVTKSICLEASTTYILNMYDGPPCRCCPSRQMAVNPAWHTDIPRPDLDLPGNR